MKKPKGYKKIVVDNQTWFWKLGKRNIHARSESGQNIVSLIEDFPAEELLVTEDVLASADDDLFDRISAYLGEKVRYYTPKSVEKWIRKNQELGKRS